MENLITNIQTAIRTAETLCRILQTEDLPAGIRVNIVNVQLYELNVVLDTIGLSPVEIERMGTLELKLPVTNLYRKLRASLDVLYKLDGALTPLAQAATKGR